MFYAHKRRKSTQRIPAQKNMTYEYASRINSLPRERRSVHRKTQRATRVASSMLAAELTSLPSARHEIASSKNAP